MTILLSGGAAFAQSSPPPASPAADDCAALLKPCEQAIDELKVLRVEVAGLREQIRLRDERDKLKDELIASAREQSGFWKAAATERKAALSVDTRIEAIQTAQLMECKSEVARLRNPGLLQRLFRPDTLTAGVIGFGVGTLRK